MNLISHRSEYKNFNLKLIGIFAKNREEWTLCDMACALYGYVLVPLYDTLTPEAISYVL
jgi:long-chain acyl-CoA synthetase